MEEGVEPESHGGGSEEPGVEWVNSSGAPTKSLSDVRKAQRRAKATNDKRAPRKHNHPQHFSCTHPLHRQTIRCILTLPIGEPVLQEQHDLPEVFLREHVLQVVLYDELHYVQLVCKGEVNRYIKCREGLWQVGGVDGALRQWSGVAYSERI